jgi:hypothetical protein
LATQVDSRSYQRWAGGAVGNIVRVLGAVFRAIEYRVQYGRRCRRRTQVRASEPVAISRPFKSDLITEEDAMQSSIGIEFQEDMRRRALKLAGYTSDPALYQNRLSRRHIMTSHRVEIDDDE